MNGDSLKFGRHCIFFLVLPIEITLIEASIRDMHMFWSQPLWDIHIYSWLPSWFVAYISAIIVKIML